MGTLAIVLGVLTGVAVMALLFKPIFDDFDGFAACLRYSWTPDIWSWFNGEGFEDMWAEMKLGFWWTCGIGTGFGVYSLLA
jgi:hypothetical protein